jgi:arylsulfatase B/arylsulfatase I/J
MRVRTLLLLLIAVASGAKDSQKPNVVFVVVDDLGWDDVGFRSGDIETPHIVRYRIQTYISQTNALTHTMKPQDGFAKEGVVLEQYYVQDVCSPSRATFLTGRYPIHHTITDWIPPASAYGLPLNETVMAEKFKEAGYATAASGKWHVGFYKKEMTPTFRGFDSFLGFYGGGEDYMTHMNSGAYDFRRDSRPHCGTNCSEINAEDAGTYSTHVFTREAIRVISEHDTTKPLFLYLAYQVMLNLPSVTHFVFFFQPLTHIFQTQYTGCARTSTSS